MIMVKEATSKTYADSIKNGLVLVKFWAPWCTSCMAMDPVVQQVQDQIPSVDVVKVNVDEDPEFAISLGIKGIPAMFLYKDGEEVWKDKGPKAFGALVEQIAPYV
jgi:thioredoxin 1